MTENIQLEKGNRLIPDFEPAFPSLSKEAAMPLEEAVKSEYKLTDFVDPQNPEGYKGWNLKDTYGNEVVYSPNSRHIVTKEYLRKDAHNNPTETLLDLVARVSVNIANAERKYDPQADVLETAKKFAGRILRREFAPNTPTFANAGGHLQQLAACFGMVVEDYLGTDDIGEDADKQGNGIFDILRYGAMIQKSGGGTGYNMSSTRPRNAGIATTGGRASGPISWYRVFNSGTQEINQGGFRRGANMGVLESWHPDIFEFLSIKLNNHLPFFNFSMGIDAEFRKNYEEGGSYFLISPKDIKTVPLEQRILMGDMLMKKKDFDGLREEEKEDLNPSLLLSDDGKEVIVRYTGKKVGVVGEQGRIKIGARETLEYAAEMACRTGCPGVIFFDRMNQDNPTPHVGEIKVVNPCGEQPLLNFEACNLGSVNLYSCIEDVPAEEFGNARIAGEKPNSAELARKGDYFYGKVIRGDNGQAIQRRFNLRKFGEIVNDGVRFLDDVIDVGKYPFKKVYYHVKANRKIGLGVMGVSESAVSLGISYESEDMEGFARFISGYMREHAVAASRELAKTRGSFPNWKGSIYDPESPHAKKEFVGDMRNATQLTIAPNGTTGQYAGVTGGIEPKFGLLFIKNMTGGVKLFYRDELFEQELKLRGIYSNGLVEKVRKAKSVQNIPEISEDMKARYKLATEVSPIWHVRIQAAFQENIDNAVSKTVNLPANSTPQDFLTVFEEAMKRGCKGVTGYRQDTIDEQPLTIGAEEKVKKISLEESVVRIHVPPTSSAMKKADKTDKYRVDREEDAFHIVFTYNLMKEPETNKFYFVPHENFQLTAPPGDEIAVEFSVAGIDRTDMLKGPDPNYVKMIERWKSVTGNRSAGFGASRINSPSHAVGLAFEHAMLSNGIVAYDEQTHKLVQKVKKSELIPITEEERIHLLNNASSSIEQRVVDKKVTGFLCGECGCTDYWFDQGCHEPKCKECGWSKRGSCS